MLTPHQFRDNNKGNEEGKERKKVLLGDAFGFFDFDFFWICFGWFVGCSKYSVFTHSVVRVNLVERK